MLLQPLTALAYSVGPVTCLDSICGYMYFAQFVHIHELQVYQLELIFWLLVHIQINYVSASSTTGLKL